MLRMWFHGVDHLLLWILAASVVYSLHLSFYDLEHKDARPFPENADVHLRPGRASRSKIVIFFVEGLKMSSFLRNIHKSNVFGRIVANEGVWGRISWESPPAGSIGFEPFFTGNPEGFGPSVLAMADRVTFVGKLDLLPGLKLPCNYSGLFGVDPLGIQPVMIGSTLIFEPSLAQVMESARRKDLWEHDNVEALIVHMTGLGIIVRMEGELSYRAQFTLQNIFAQFDAVLTELEHLFSNETVTYIVTSVGVDVPIVAWGHGIDKARFPDRDLFQQVSYQIPTVPRDINVLRIAPLLACLIGGPPPINSIGALPEQYLSLEKQEIAQCHIEGAENVLKHFKRQAHEVINDGLMNLPSLSADIMTTEELVDRFARLNLVSMAGDYQTVRTLASTIISECLVGIEHYRNFRSRLLTHIIFIMLTGCLVCCATLLCSACATEPENMVHNQKDWLRIPSLKINPAVDAMFCLFLIISHVVVGIDNFPLRFHLYVATTVIPWWIAFRKLKNWLFLAQPDRVNHRHNVGQKLVDTFYIVLCIATGITTASNIPTMVIFLVSMVFICLTSLVTKSDTKVSLWLFTALPLVAALSYTSDENAMPTSRIVAISCWLVLAWIVTYRSSTDITDYPIIISMTLGALIICFSYQIRTAYHVVWLVLCFIPMIGSQNLVVRFVQIFLSIGIPFILLSTGGEMIAFLAFVIHASTWMLAESYVDVKDLVHQTVHMEESPNGRRFGSVDLRMNYFFNLYCMLAIPVVHSTGFKNACWKANLVRCDIKTAASVLAASVLYAHAIRRNRGQRYYSLALSSLYFTFLIFFSFLNIYSLELSDGLTTDYDLTPVQAPIKVWSSVLVCSWLADFLLCPSLFNKRVVQPRQIP